MEREGLLVIISAPSGGGKTTILRKVFRSGNDAFRYSISVTTRSRRLGEVDGQDYHFITRDEFFRRRAAGDFVEWAEVHGNYYATLRSPLRLWLAEGKLIFLDLDVDGGLKVKKLFGDLALLIFVKPPTFQSLVERLNLRDTETEAEIEVRLQRYPKEIARSEEYDVCIINSNLDNTVAEVLHVIEQRYCYQ